MRGHSHISVPPDYPALVIGCGALGQFGVKTLRLLSGAEIIAVELDDGKLNVARESGATRGAPRDDNSRRKVQNVRRDSTATSRARHDSVVAIR